jgi:uncharacterized protein (DUF2236 family)
MLWVIAPMYDSARVLYELLVRPLSTAEREQLWQEYLLFGELFGMPREVAPATAVALDAWWEERLASEEIFLTDQARAVGRSIGFKLPVPPAAKPAMRAANLTLRGSLPPQVREQYGLPWSAGDEVAFRALARSVRLGRPLVPRSVRRGSCMPFYDLIARRERVNVRAGKRSFDVPAAP